MKLLWIIDFAGMINGILLSLMLLSAGFSYADTLIFPEGKVLHGEIASEYNNLITFNLMVGGKLIMPATIPVEIRKEPKVDYLIKRADYQSSRGNESEAMTFYIQALEIDPGNEIIRNRIDNIRTRRLIEEVKEKIAFGERLVDEGEYRKAITFYKTLLQYNLTPSITRSILTRIATAHARIAYVFYDHCFEEWALQEISKAEEYNPQVPLIHYVLGRIHQDRKEVDLAKREYKKSLELDPTFKDAEDRLTEINKAAVTF